MSRAMRLLYATGTPRRHGPRPRFATDQIDVGPDQLDRALGEKIFSRAAPAGAYDLAALVRASFSTPSKAARAIELSERQRC